MITSNSGLTIVNENFSVVLSHQRPSSVILTVPHDGLIANDFSRMFQERQHGWKGRDLYVWPIANEIIQQCLQSEMKVNAVRFLMARAYVDANREMLDQDMIGQTALEDRRLTGIYRHYHSEISRLLELSLEAFGDDKVLLIDLHGFGKQPEFAPPKGYDLILGTANRTTIRYGEIDRIFAQSMRNCGYRVFLPSEKSVVPNKSDPYSAGHTTRWYSKQFGINTLQIEISSRFRNKESKKLGEQLAVDIAGFLSEQCP
ncbi:MAG: N-formylglutamate amidohydrolase [Candidatus Paceibacterota bacterium]